MVASPLGTGGGAWSTASECLRGARGKKVLFRGFSIAFAFLFAFATVVQLNDPDAPLWVALYGVAFALTTAACFGRFSTLATALAVAGYAIALGIWSPALLRTSWDAVGSIEMKSPDHEEVREAWGLATCLAWSIALLVRSRRGASRGRP